MQLIRLKPHRGRPKVRNRGFRLPSPVTRLRPGRCTPAVEPKSSRGSRIRRQVPAVVSKRQHAAWSFEPSTFQTLEKKISVLGAGQPLLVGKHGAAGFTPTDITWSSRSRSIFLNR
ncbi:hypothetical protein TNCV_1257081 [Trichonephila clavipes]|nr:hypothetical protein TNCV_1257081 [Trichonephila clavipes]